MKKIILGLFLISGMSVFGQMEKTFSSTDSSQLIKLIDLIVKNAKNKYQLNNVNNMHENAIEAIYTSGSYKLIIEFSRVKPVNSDGSNNPGPANYTFVSVTGLYKDIFPFWKKYYQPGARSGATTKARHGEVLMTPYLKGKMISSFNKYGDYWEIENRYAGTK